MTFSKILPSPNGVAADHKKCLAPGQQSFLVEWSIFSRGSSMDLNILNLYHSDSLSLQGDQATLALWSYQDRQAPIFKFCPDISDNEFLEIRKCFRKTAKFDYFGETNYQVFGISRSRDSKCI